MTTKLPDHESEAIRLLDEALAEDYRGNSRFDVTGFSNFFPEEIPEVVGMAWTMYQDWHNADRIDGYDRDLGESPDY